jgi:GPH family glycoside/pentoside/hexuronide:cation symporter
MQIISSFLFGFKSPLVFAIFADTADYAEWRTGRRNTGLFFASAIFSTKVGGAAGGFLLGIVLSHNEYAANVSQTGRSIDGIVLAMSLVPCLILILSAAAMAFFPLSDTLALRIEEGLRMRRGEIIV